MNELLVVLSWNKMSLYSILDNIPSDSNVLIYNLKWLNSNIESKLIANDYIRVIDIEFKEDFVETLNSTLVDSDINASKIVLLKPEKIPVYNLIAEYLKKIENRQVYSHESFYMYWYDKNITKNIRFTESKVLTIFDLYIESLVNLLEYKILPETNIKKTEEVLEEKENRYKTIIYSRCKKLLFDQIEDYSISDKLFSINFGKNNFNVKLRRTLDSFKDDEYFILINHYSYSLDSCLSYLKNVEVKNNLTISENETHNKIYVITKKFLLDLNISNYFTDIEILKTIENNTELICVDKNINEQKVSYVAEKQEVQNVYNSNNHYIFILPFMDNGDRRGLFESTLKNLKYQLNRNSSISGEILIFECR